jgi:ribosomal protein S6--L-glutamate ligase
MKIVILSKGPANYSTKRLKEVALARGHEVRVINYAKCYVTLERGKPVVHYGGEEVRDVDVIIPRIAANLTGYGSAIVRQFEMQNVPTTTSSIAIVRSRDKLRSMQLMAKAGVGIPKTVFARETADFEGVLEQVGGAPVIIKVARGTHGNGVVLGETRKAALAVMQAFYVEGVNFLVQEYVAESAGVDIRAFVVNGKVVASMIRQSLDD